MLKGVAREGTKTMKKKQLTICAVPYQLVKGYLYKMGRDEILRRCVLEHEHKVVIAEVHGGIT